MARRFGYILCAQWGSGILVTLFMIVLARTGPDVLGQIAVAQAFGALVAMATSAGFTDFLVARLNSRGNRPRRVLAEGFCCRPFFLPRPCFAWAWPQAYWAIPSRNA